MNVEIITPRGTLPSTHHNSKRYVEAVSGESYRIRLSNTTGRRRLVVLSVDGLNTIDGSSADYSGRGWVVGPHSSIILTGWKLNDQQAAAFTFGSSEESYAAESGHGTKNVGVIGAAVFEEKRRRREKNPWDDGSVWRTPMKSSGRLTRTAGGLKASWSSGGTYSSTASPQTCSRPTATVNTSSVGTQFGQKVDMATTTTTFVRATSAPAEIISLHYGTAEDLQSWGVTVPVAGPAPSPFPGEGCAPPPGWQG